jgi:hypothetical protein
MAMNDFDIRRVQQLVGRELPASWRVVVAGDGTAVRELAVDMPDRAGPRFRLAACDDPEAVIAVPAVVEVCERLTLTDQRRLAARDVSYIDVGSGAMRLRSDDPPLFMLIRKPPSSTKVQSSASASLSGRAGARLCRTLIDRVIELPASTTSIAVLAGISQPQASRLVARLDLDGVLRRRSDGGVSAYDWERVLQRWTSDYDPARMGSLTMYRSLQGPRRAMELLAGEDGYAVTGGWAAAAYAPAVQPRELTLISQQPSKLAARLGLIEVDRDADVYIRGVEKDDLPLLRTRRMEGIECCAPAQVVADIAGDRARGDAAREALIEWMRRDDSWRL